MKKFKYWLVRFVVEIDSMPISQMMVVELPESVSASVCAHLVDKLQRTLFTHWPEVPQDEDCPCANEGTHRKTRWLSFAGKSFLTVCIHWDFKQGITRGMAMKLKQAGVEWKHLPI